MTAPLELRLRVEVAFPGSTIEADPEIDGWCVAFPAPVDLDGVDVGGFSCLSDGQIMGYQFTLTAAVVATAKSRWSTARVAIHHRLQSATAHELVAAKLRLGL